MTIKHMKIFIQVYKIQNITQAAEILHMTQPAVSRAIQEIERHYGVSLFERMNRRLSVTESGKQFYAQALHIVEAFNDMEKEMQNWDKFGVLRIGSSVSIGNFLLPQIVSIFQNRNPNIKIQVKIANGNALQVLLLDNQIDIALIEGSVEELELHTESFNRDQLVLITSPGHPLLCEKELKLEDLIKYPMLLREKGSGVRTYLDDAFSVRGITLHPSWESTSTQAIVKAVHLGIGISFLPKILVNKDIEDGVVKTHEIADMELSRQHYIVWHKNKYLTTVAKQFIELCKEVTALSSTIENAKEWKDKY